ncbi:hypothetical protein UF75_2101 [Desulfosporosinus sp. I2]|nr:hypothetical protein UF75_2101 [Desulfosporosinus sp. I2]
MLDYIQSMIFEYLLYSFNLGYRFIDKRSHPSFSPFASELKEYTFISILFTSLLLAHSMTIFKQ